MDGIGRFNRLNVRWAAFRQAEGQRKAGDIDFADATVEEALGALHERH